MAASADSPARVQAVLEALSPWLRPATSVLGVDISAAEAAAFALGVAMVVCNLRVSVWGWPLAIASALLYALVFAQARLYGQVGLQGVFIGVSLWGWHQWRRGAGGAGRVGAVGRLSPRGRWAAATATLLAWPVLAWWLGRADGQQPWLDALPSVASITAQVLLASKRVETWPLWVAVNVLSMALFARQGLWLTVLLYAVFAVLAVAGWRAWSRRLEGTVS